MSKVRAGIAVSAGIGGELFNPDTKKWRPIAVGNHPRTYHNTAILRPDGTVLVGGHATISTAYLNDTTLPGGFAPHDGRDPSFEVFKPPYLFRGTRPTIRRARAAMAPGTTFGIRLGKGEKADDIDSVRISRNSAVTHLVDGDQHQVVLPVTGRKGDLLLVKVPPNGDVAPRPVHAVRQPQDRQGPDPLRGQGGHGPARSGGLKPGTQTRSPSATARAATPGSSR